MSGGRRAARPDEDSPGGYSDSTWLHRVADRDFSPTAPELDRVETRALAAFRAAHRVADRALARGPATKRSGHPAFAGARIGRAVRLAFAVALVVVVVGAGGAAASGPGAPLYAVRLAVERTMLPAPGQPARVDAELALVDRRLADAATALRRNDAGAASAALEAVVGDVAAVGRDAALHPSRRPEALTRLDEDEALVRRLGADLAGSDAVREALDALRSARHELTPAPDHAPPDDSLRRGLRPVGIR